MSGEVTCADCLITLDTVLTIGGLDGPGTTVVSVTSGVAVDRRGRFLVWAFGPSEISVFDSAGGYIRTIGGRGEGPGEYGTISYVGVGPRYIHVFELREGRTMLDHDFQVVRTDRFPGHVPSVAIVRDDVAVFSALTPTPASVGRKLNVLGPSGEMTSHSDDDWSWSAPPSYGSAWLTMAGKQDTVWIVTIDNRLIRWRLDPPPGVVRVMERSVAEFDQGGGALGPAAVNAAMLDDRGLWIVWHSADPDWAEPPPRPGSRELPPARHTADGWLDLVEPATGRTLARYRQDGIFLGFADGSSYVIGYQETDAGVPLLHILEPRLSRR